MGWSDQSVVRVTSDATLGLEEVHHGIRAADDPGVMRFLADHRIRLNVCPSSNVLLGYAASYRDHPIRILHESGVPVTINTDDLLLFDSPICSEYLHLYRSGALTAAQLDAVRRLGLEPLRAENTRKEQLTPPFPPRIPAGGG